MTPTQSNGEVVYTQLATRITKALHRAMKLHCVKADVSVMQFVTDALEEKLAREQKTPAKRPQHKEKKTA